tara:strand:+ start:803 stop:1048 length:246 start_codon:yes stop_codon:yes gene_type:complete
MTFQLLVFAVDREIYVGQAKSVTVPGAEGELQILADHTPVVAKLKEGDIRIEGADGTEKKLPIAGGILEVKPEEVVVLVNF